MTKIQSINPNQLYIAQNSEVTPKLAVIFKSFVSENRDFSQKKLYIQKSYATLKCLKIKAD